MSEQDCARLRELAPELALGVLSGEERAQLEGLLNKGKGPAQRLLKARILLKADVSEPGEGWKIGRAHV